MPKRGNTVWTVRPGDSVYPLKKGCLFKLNGTSNIINKYMNIHYPHEIYVFVRHVRPIVKGSPPHERTLLVTKFYVPLGIKEKYVTYDTRIRVQSLYHLIHDHGGFKTLKSFPGFDRTKEYWYRIFVEIGLMPKLHKTKQEQELELIESRSRLNNIVYPKDIV